MKTPGLMLAAVLVAAVAGAQGYGASPAPSTSPKTEKTAAKPAAKAEHKATKAAAEEWKAEVVSVDKDKKEITIKLENETSPKTVGYSETAAQEMSDLKAGEQVLLTVHENEKGEKVAHHVKKHAATAKAGAAEKKPVEKKSSKPASPGTR